MSQTQSTCIFSCGNAFIKTALDSYLVKKKYRLNLLKFCYILLFLFSFFLRFSNLEDGSTVYRKTVANIVSLIKWKESKLRSSIIHPIKKYPMKEEFKKD